MYGVGFPIFLFLFQMHKNNQFQKKEKEKTDADTICGNKLLPVNQKSRDPHFFPVSEPETTNKECCGKCKEYDTSYSPWENFE